MFAVVESPICARTFPAVLRKIRMPDKPAAVEKRLASLTMLWFVAGVIVSTRTQHEIVIFVEFSGAIPVEYRFALVPLNL